MSFVEVTEGNAKVLVPNPDLYRRPDGVYEPAWAPVFYNPRMAANRDVALLLTYVCIGDKEFIFIDALAGTGVRGIRIAKAFERAKVILNDIDPAAVAIIEENLKKNAVEDRCEVYCMDANTLLCYLRESGTRANVVDIDPYGSPIYFVERAALTLRQGGVLAATATDVAVLAGSHPRACSRRYDAHAIKTDFDKELAARILVGSIVRRCASWEVAAKPILVYFIDHYLRAYFTISKGARRTDEVKSQVKYMLYCRNCCYREYTDEPSSGSTCPICSSTLACIGPLWSSDLWDRNLLQAMISATDYVPLADKKKVRKLLEAIMDEVPHNVPYYRVDRLCSFLRISMPKMNELVEAIRSEGFEASRTHFDPRGIRTNAPHSILLEILKTRFHRS